MMKRAVVISVVLLVAACSQREQPRAADVASSFAEQPGPSTVIGIHHVRLTVSDLDRSLAYYQGATQFELVERGVLEPSTAFEEAAGQAGIGGERALLRGPNGQLELVEFDEEDLREAPILSANGPGMAHICFQSPKDKPLYERFRDRGAVPVTRGGEPVDMLGRNYFYMYSRGPDGALVEVEHATAPNFTDDVWFGHVAYATPDLNRFAAFYSALIGRQPYNTVQDISGPTFDQVAGLDNVNFDGTWISAGNMIVEIWQYNSPPTEPAASLRPATALGHSLTMFEVADIANDVQRIEFEGGAIVSKIEEAGDRRTVYARDPDGNLIGLVQFEKGSERSVAQLKQITWSLN